MALLSLLRNANMHAQEYSRRVLLPSSSEIHIFPCQLENIENIENISHKI